MFRSLFYDHPQGSSFVLGAFTIFGGLLRHLPSRYVAVCSLCVSVSGVPDTGVPVTHVDGIRPHTKKANDEAKSGKVVNALSTEDDP
jgi:hypothetical protein